MKFADNIKDYLFDKDYFINIYDNHLYVFNYNDIPLLSENKIVVKINDFQIKIKGTSLIIIKLTTKELLIKGNITSLEIIK